MRSMVEGCGSIPLHHAAFGVAVPLPSEAGEDDFMITRFAPSPTGRLHVGNLRTALHNWLWARAAGGRFLLRIDDTDAERSREAWVAAIRADLAWLGIEAGGEARQSERFPLYDAALDRLAAAGRAYPAWDTPEELDLRRRVLMGRGLPPVYERTALDLSADDRARLEAERGPPHWRFRLDHSAPIEWYDAVRGPQRFDPALLSDPVIRRADATWLYLLPSVVDDVALGVTHVLRGEDHVSNTAVQTQMIAALGAEPPIFAHEALLVGEEGKLAKRLGSFGVDDVRALGVEPVALAALLARLGSGDPVEPVASLDELAAGFAPERLGRAPARFDPAELTALNAKVLHALPFAPVADRLPAGMDEAAWRAIRPNLTVLADAAAWWRVVTGPLAAPPQPEEGGYLAAAAEIAAGLDWDTDPWSALTGALKRATGRTGRALFHPLRLAITGRGSGPDMATLLPLIGRDEAVARLGAGAGAGKGGP